MSNAPPYTGHPRSRATDPLTLIAFLPKDAADLRSLSAALEDLDEAVDPHLDAFCSTDPSRRGIDRAALVELFGERRRELELGIMALTPRLSTLPPRSLYPGQLLARLCDDVLGRPKGTALTRLLSRIEPRAPARWARVVASFRALSDSTRGWREWPPPDRARAVVAALEAVARTWSTVRDELRRETSGGINRERRRDPAFRRAINWHEIAVELLRRLTVPGGPLRLMIDYHFAVIANFETAIVNGPEVMANQAASDLLILEVFDRLARCSLTEALVDGGASLEQGDTRRRKRIQRARLQVVLKWEALIDDPAWLEWAYPALDRLIRGPELDRADARAGADAVELTRRRS
jgi:hypothetical protein